MNTENHPVGFFKPLPESKDSIVPCKNKKRNTLKMAALYDNMISSSYSLINGDLDKEKIANQMASFARN